MPRSSFQLHCPAVFFHWMLRELNRIDLTITQLRAQCCMMHVRCHFNLMSACVFSAAAPNATMTEQLIHPVELGDGDDQARRRVKGVTDAVLLSASMAPKLPGLCRYEQRGNYCICWWMRKIKRMGSGLWVTVINRYRGRWIVGDV